MKNRDYVRKFSNITMSKICKKVNVNRNNLYRLKETDLQKVKEEIESEIAKLYIKED